MSGMWLDIERFHQKFVLPQNAVPGLLTQELYAFRLKFLYEELAEFEDACERKDMVKAFDALLDLVYVAMGTAYVMNMPWEEGWDQVQMANMMKMRAEKESQSTRGSTFDVVKPEGWVPPDRMLLSVIIAYEHKLLVEKFWRLGKEVTHEQK